MNPLNLFELYAKLFLDSSEYESGIAKMKQKTYDAANKIKTGFLTATSVGAAAIAAFGVSSIKTGAEFDASMSQVAATMGKTTDEIQDLRDFALEMGSTTAFSASQAADALNYMALAGYDADTSMEMLPDVLNLAAAGSMDLAAASDMLTDSQSALGLNLEQTAELVDKMAKAASSSNTSVEQLGSAILTVGGTAKDLAGGTTELSTALGILANNGIKGAEGGTALRNIILSLTPKSEDAAKAFEELGLNAYDANGNLRPLNETFADLRDGLSSMTQEQRTNTLSNIFNVVDLKSVNALLAGTEVNLDGVNQALEASGFSWEKYGDAVWMANSGSSGLLEEVIWNLKEAGTSAEELQEYLQFEYDIDAVDAMSIIQAVQANVDASTSSWDALEASIGDATGAAQQMADTQLDNLEGDITILKSAFEGLQISIADKLMPAARKFIQWITDLIDNIGTVGPIIAGVATAFGTFAVAINIASIIEKAVIAFNALWLVLSANPIGLVIAAITGIIAAIVTLWNTNEKFRDAVGPIWEQIKGFFVSAWEAIKTTWDAAKPYFELIWHDIQRIFSVVEEVLGGFFKVAWEAIKLVWDAVTGYFQALWNTIAGIFEVVDAVLSGDFSRAWEAIKGIFASWRDFFSGLWDDLLSVFSTIKDVFLDIGRNLVEGLLGGIKERWNNLTGWIGQGIQNLKNMFTGKQGFDEHSPSKWAETVFANVAEGGIAGWNKTFPELAGDLSGDIAGLRSGFALGSFAMQPAFTGGMMGSMSGMASMGVQQRAPIVIQVQLDKKTIAQATYDATQTESTRRGASLINP